MGTFAFVFFKIMEEDFDFNPFYQALSGRLYALHQTAQEKCYVICVPHSSSISESDVSTKFAEMHILQRSPYFAGTFLTTDLGKSKTLELENGFLLTTEGKTKTERKIKVLAEEIGYNSDYKSYRILLISEPIWT